MNPEDYGFVDLKPLYVYADGADYFHKDSNGAIITLPSTLVGRLTRLEIRVFPDGNEEKVKLNVWITPKGKYNVTVLTTGIATIFARNLLRSLQGVNNLAEAIVGIEVSELKTNKTNRLVSSCIVYDLTHGQRDMIYIRDLPAVPDEEAARRVIEKLNKQIGYKQPAQNKTVWQEPVATPPSPQQHSPRPVKQVYTPPTNKQNSSLADLAEAVYIAAELNGITRQAINNYFKCDDLSSLGEAALKECLAQYEGNAREEAKSRLFVNYVKAEQRDQFDQRLQDRFGTSVVDELRTQDLLSVYAAYKRLYDQQRK